jgi:hypothetical protein
MIRRAALLAVLAAAIGAPGLAAQQQGWRTYANPRFGYSICYPDDLSESGRPADNGDGRVFADRAGAELRVWGQYNGEEDTIASAADRLRGYETADGIDVTYTAKGRDWLVLSWRQGGHIFYERAWLSRNRFVTFLLSYPATAAARWNAAIPKIAACVHDTPEGPLQ